MALCPGLRGYQKIKPIWILLKQETVSGSGISWAICKSAPRSWQITMPAPHHSVFYKPDAFIICLQNIIKYNISHTHTHTHTHTRLTAPFPGKISCQKSHTKCAIASYRVIRSPEKCFVSAKSNRSGRTDRDDGYGGRVLLLESSHMRRQLERLVIVAVTHARIHQLRHLQNLQQLSVFLQCQVVRPTPTYTI